MKEAIIQAYLLSSPFWKGSLEAVKWYLSAVPARPKQLCWKGKGRKKLPDVHQVGLLFSIPLHSPCFLRDLLEYNSAARVNLWSATAHLQVFYCSICKVKQAIFIQVDLPPPWSTQQQSNSLKQQTAMREYIQPCMNTTVNTKK